MSRRIRSIGIAERRIIGKVRTKEIGFISRRTSYRAIRANKLQKLLKIFLDKDQKHFSVGEELSLSIFLLRKDERALRSLAKQRFLAEIKVA